MRSASVAGAGTDRIAISSDPLDVADHHVFVADPSAGCSVVFTGMVRDHAPGRDDVSSLEYEAYAGVVEATIERVIAEAREQWSVIRVAVSHRIGLLTVGEPAVVVAVSAAHRDEAFPAARFVIDEVKARAPIWKKETWPGGAEWVEGA
jgi:molybdopterin synthase catalytic subunit